MTWARMFETQVGEDVPAVAVGDGMWTSRTLAALAAGAIDWLDSVDAPHGQAVPALLSTTAEAVALAVAGATSDRPLAPLNPRLTARELAGCIEPLGSPVLVAEPAAADVAGAVAAMTGVRVEIVPALAESSRPLDYGRADDAVAVVLHTSGTTGVPKAVPIRQHKLALRAQRQGAVMGLGPGTTYTSFSPFPHIAGLGTLFIALGLGAAAVPCPPFTTDIWRGLTRFAPTHGLLVPTMIETLLAEGALRLPSLRVLVYGSSPIRPVTLRAAVDALPGVELLNMYGQTEGSPLTYLDGADHERALAGRPDLLLTVGRPVDGVELRIENPGDDGTGEVCARAEHMFRIDADGWLRTGDIGVLNDEGYLKLVGRKGDLIIRGGENVYPVEVENVVSEHPAVREVAVVGAPHARLGQEVCAFIVAADASAPPEAAGLRAFAREQLAGYKVPSSWFFVDGLPRNPTGKVVRRELEAQVATDRSDISG